MLLTQINLGYTICTMIVSIIVFCITIQISVERICHDTKIGNKAATLFGVFCSIGAILAMILVDMKIINMG